MFLRSCTALLIACLAVSGANAEKPKIEAVKLPDKGIDFAIHAAKGHLAVLQNKGLELAIYPDVIEKRKADKDKIIKFEKPAKNVVFKKVGAKNYFVVLSEEEKALIVIDADAGDVLKKIGVDLKQVLNLVVSNNPLDPYAYYCGGEQHNTAIRRIHVEKMLDEGYVEKTQSVSRGELLGDGSILYTHSPSSPSGIRAYALEPGSKNSKPWGRTLHNRHASARYYLPDPFSQFVVVDERVCSPDLKEHRAVLPSTPHFISEVRPYLVGINGKSLDFMSVNTFKKIGSIDLPAVFQMKAVPPPKPGVPPPAPLPKTRILEHPASETLLLCLEDDVGILPLKDAGIPNEPMLAFIVGGSKNMMIGQAQEIALSMCNPSTKVELKEAPKGLALEEGKLAWKLKWTPEDAQVGSNNVRLELSADKVTVTREVVLNVRRPSIEFDFVTRDMAIAPDATLALVVGHEPIKPHQREPLLNRLALVDLNKAAVAAERTMKVPILCAAIDDHFVYASSAESDTLFVLDRKTLGDVKEIFTTGRAGSLTPVGNKFLFVAGPKLPMVLKLPELKEAEPSEVGLGIHLAKKGESRAAIPLRLGENWWYDGCLYGADFVKPRMIVDPPAFWSNRMGRADEDVFRGETTYPTWLGPWSIYLGPLSIWQNGRSVILRKGPQHFEGGPHASVLLVDQPAVVTLRLATFTQLQKQQIKLELQFHDIVAGALHVEMPLRDEPSLESIPPGQDGPRLRLGARGGKLVAAYNHNLYVAAVPKLDPKKFPMPAHFETKQPTLDDTADSIPLARLDGVKDPAEISFKEKVPGVTLDAKKKALILDREAVVREGANICKKAFLHHHREHATFEKYAREMSPLYEAFVGKKPSGVPVWISIELNAKDDNMRTAMIRQGFFVDVPFEEIKKVVAKMPKDPNVVEPQADLQKSVQDLQKKVDQLEKQMIQLKEALDRLNKNLEKKD